jgi:hypothetical protein
MSRMTKSRVDAHPAPMAQGARRALSTASFVVTSKRNAARDDDASPYATHETIGGVGVLARSHRAHKKSGGRAKIHASQLTR